MKVGQWVRFWTRNWPAEVRAIEISLDTSEVGDTTGQGPYLGRGRIVRIHNGYLIKEERTDRLIQVGPDERVEPLGQERIHQLTLGDIRKFLAEYPDAPDDIPVTVSLPVRFNCDEEDRNLLPEGHPESHDVSELWSVPACNVLFLGFEEGSGVSADSYVPPEEREQDEEWSFFVEIILHPKESHDVLRGEDCR